MPSATSDTGTITSAMSFAGGLLSLLAVIVAIVNDRLKKAQSTEETQRIISNILAALSVLLIGAGAVIGSISHVGKVSVWLTFWSMVVWVARFVQDREQPSRVEIAAIVLWVAITVFEFLGYAIISLNDSFLLSLGISK